MIWQKIGFWRIRRRIIAAFERDVTCVVVMTHEYHVGRDLKTIEHVVAGWNPAWTIEGLIVNYGYKSFPILFVAKTRLDIIDGLRVFIDQMDGQWVRFQLAQHLKRMPPRQWRFK